jgi:type I restriction enzyme S subunit
MKWPVLRLEQLAAKEPSAIKIGPFGSQLKKSELVDTGIHVVGIENVLANKFDGLGDRFITEEKFSSLRSVEIRPGDVLITMMGTIGEVAIVPPGTSTSIMDSHLLRFRPNTKLCSAKYIAWLIRGNAATRMMLHGRAHGAIMKGLNSDIIRSLPAPLPSSSEQKKIIAILDQAEDLRRKRSEADHRIEQLFVSLFHRGFSGELTGKWREAHMKELLTEMEEQAKLLGLHSVENGISEIKRPNS